MTDPLPDPAAALVDGAGQPARRRETEACPRCGAGPDRRVPSGGFGTPHEVCGACGYEGFPRSWRGPRKSEA